MRLIHVCFINVNITEKITKSVSLYKSEKVAYLSKNYELKSYLWRLIVEKTTDKQGVHRTV